MKKIHSLGLMKQILYILVLQLPLFSQIGFPGIPIIFNISKEFKYGHRSGTIYKQNTIIDLNNITDSPLQNVFSDMRHRMSANAYMSNVKPNKINDSKYSIYWQTSATSPFKMHFAFLLIGNNTTTYTIRISSGSINEINNIINSAQLTDSKLDILKYFPLYINSSQSIFKVNYLDDIFLFWMTNRASNRPDIIIKCLRFKSPDLSIEQAENHLKTGQFITAFDLKMTKYTKIRKNCFQAELITKSNSKIYMKLLKADIDDASYIIEMFSDTEKGFAALDEFVADIHN